MSMKIKRKRKPVDYKILRKSMTVPDQSMSIREIVKRFVRGIPVDIVQRHPVYLDQSDHDLEKLSRMEFGEKAELASQLGDHAAELQREHNDKVRQRAEEEATAKAQRLKERQAKKHSSTLDNTMLNDTRQK